jgi:hypothetical protein
MWFQHKIKNNKKRYFAHKSDVKYEKRRQVEYHVVPASSWPGVRRSEDIASADEGSTSGGG